MSLQVEKLEKNMAKLTVEAEAKELEAAIVNAYNKNKKRFNIPGFRKGKAPLKMIEKMYGVGVFYEDAANEVIGKTYPTAADESGLQIVSRPEIDVTQMEKGKTFIYIATVACKPEVTLGQYKDLVLANTAVEITDEDINKEIAKAQEQNSRLISVEDRPVADGDQTVIDFTGFINGTPFEGGRGYDYPLTIGSHSFIDTFEEQLIGKKIGEECEVNVVFPEEYHSKELANKPAMFKVTIKEIKVKELPAVDDEFASEVSEFDTLDEYKADIKATILEKKQKDAKTERENQLVDMVIENAVMDIPGLMIETQLKTMVDDYSRRMQSQGLTLEQYMQYTGLSIENIQEQMKPQALKRIQSRLVLEAIVNAENIQVTEEDLEKEMNEMAAAYKMDLDKVKEHFGANESKEMKMDIAVQKAVDLLVAESKESE